MDYRKLSDNDLVGLSAEGDCRAFEVLVRRYSSLVMGLALARLGDRDRSRDVVQETFLRVFKKLGDYSRKAKFSTWLYRIASNLIRDRQKYAKRHPAAPLRTEHVAKDHRFGRAAARADERLYRRERRAIVMDALDALGGELREILVLRDMQGLSYREIAEMTGCSLGTVKSRISRARMKFKDTYVRLTRR
jgi:RNA polymerase sigma-70 factor (ECF subfamily)